MFSALRNQLVSYYRSLRADNAKGEVARNTVASSGIKFGSIGVSFLLQFALARLMGAERYGDYTYVWSWITTLTLFGTLGFNVASLRFVATYFAGEHWELLRGFLRRAYQLTALLSLVLMGLFALAVFVLHRLGRVDAYLADLLWLSCPLLGAYAFLELQSGILRGGSRLTVAIAFQLIVTPGLILLFSAGVAWLTGSGGTMPAWTVLALNTVAVLTVVVVQRLAIRRWFPAAYAPGLLPAYQDRKWLSTASSMMVTAGFQRVNSHLDVLFVGSFVGRTEAGIYMVAAKLISLISLSLEITNTASAHVFARLHDRGQRKELQSVVRLSAWIAFIAAMPILIVLGLWADQILVIFGKEFVGGMIVLRVLLLGEALNLITGPNGILLSMTGHHRLLAWILSGTVVVNAGLAWLLVGPWGVIGIAAARSLAQFFRNGLGVAFVWRNVHLNPTVFSFSRGGAT